jgi:predicted transcriptional regulator
MAGRSKEVSDEDILMKFVTTADPVLVASEVGKSIEMSRQGAFSRLKELENEGLVNSAMKASARVWWITPEGRAQLSERSETHQT